MHEVLVNRLGGLSLPRKSVVRVTDRPDMTLDVCRGRKQQYNKSLRVMSGANFPPIVAWNLPATSGFLNLSRSILSLDWVGFLVFFRRTRKVIITRPRGYKIEWSSACLSFERFVFNFMLNIEHENVLKSFITSSLCSDSGIVLSRI